MREYVIRQFRKGTNYSAVIDRSFDLASLKVQIKNLRLANPDWCFKLYSIKEMELKA